MNTQSNIKVKRMVCFIGALCCSVYFVYGSLKIFSYLLLHKEAFSIDVSHKDFIVELSILYGHIFPLVLSLSMLLCLVFIKRNSKLLLIPSILLLINSFEYVILFKSWFPYNQTIQPIIVSLVLLMITVLILLFQNKKQSLLIISLLLIYSISNCVVSKLTYSNFSVIELIIGNLFILYFVFAALYLYYENKSKRNDKIEILS